MHIALDKIVRSAIANKGYNTLHLYVPYLHWAFDALSKLEEEGAYTEVRYTKDNLDENYSIDIPEDMLMWNQIGVVINGTLQVFVNNSYMSLDEKDHKPKQNPSEGLFAYDSSDLLYSSNVYIANGNGSLISSTSPANFFRVDWSERRIHFSRPVTGKVYIEYVAKSFSPSTQTLVNEVARRYFEAYIYYREARFKFGASHREAMASEREWINEEDELRKSFSDVTGAGILHAINEGTRYSIVQ